MKLAQQQSTLARLICSSCGQPVSIFEPQTFSPCCQQPLTAEYEYPESFTPAALQHRPSTMWRYAEVLPVLDASNIVSLGEGMTPIIYPKRLTEKLGTPDVYIKDESGNPTGSFKARGISVAVSKAKEFGLSGCIVPTAGNAGGAMAAYCAAAGMQAIVVMPTHTPEVFKEECRLYGAKLLLVNGLISDCAKKVAELKQQYPYFDISTMKEPYRLEGKKTMGYEIAEQFNFELPDVILYPTGGGTGLIGMWKAFAEMEAMGWIGPDRPRMIAVQAANCQPIVQRYEGRISSVKEYTGAPSLANGLAVPHPFAEKMIMRVLQESGGFPVAVEDQAMLDAVRMIANTEGMLIAPEGAALYVALEQLLDAGKIDRNEKILLLNTGSGYKYLQNL
ncbi:threonine synthase [Pseudoflavitalea sp. G-6-1-2]|uniref:threonine synthase n=1 Tax=Pseudoflavitalea sp. G-6-1-2 TaxID=2728841 RepID=UPI00146F7AF8|nr:threonine synthase [Pseudoflavitalea sp. G-6-1-2]NML23370.1 threonine synthase [Pseudoflavitalea sp. G-6-1-2]